MELSEAIEVMREMRAWMRGEGIYTRSNVDTFRCKPYTNEEFEKAIDTAVNELEKLIKQDKE